MCIPVLRWTKPNLNRPIKVNLIFPIVYIIASILVTVVPMIASPVETGNVFSIGNVFLFNTSFHEGNFFVYRNHKN